MNLNEIFSSYQFDYMTERGYSFYLIKYGTNNYSQLACLNSQELISQKKQRDDAVFNLLDKKTFLQQNRYSYYFHNLSDNLNELCFFDFFNKHPQYRQELLKDCFKYCQTSLETLYPKIFSTFDNKEVLKIFNKLTFSAFKLPSKIKADDKKIPALHDLDNYLINRNFSNEEQLSFWEQFLKVRKSLLTRPQESSYYCDFLIKKFDTEQLKVFFPFFPRLKSKFEEVDIDIIEHEALTTTTLLLNFKKCVKIFAISDWSEDKYEALMQSFVPAVAQHYKLPYYELKYINKSKKHFRLLFSHENENFNSKKLKQNVIDFFHSVKINPLANYETQDILVWLNNNKLQNLLPQKENKKTHKI